MAITVEGLIKKVRIAIDEIVDGHDVDSSFTTDLDTEIEQALWVAARGLLAELPPSMVPCVTLTNSDITVHKKNSDGSGQIGVDDNFLRLVELRLSTWKNSVWALMEPDSNEAKMQASEWTRGTPEKPRAMMGEGVSVTGQQGGESQTVSCKRSIKYWTAGKVSGAYDHTVEVLAYVKDLDDTADEADLLALAAAHQSRLVYRAAGVVMEGKQHGDLADRFYKLSEG